MSAKQKMGERILRDLRSDGYDPRYITNEVKNRILAISEEFCSAPEEHKKEVYAAAQRELLSILRSLPKSAIASRGE